MFARGRNHASAAATASSARTRVHQKSINREKAGRGETGLMCYTALHVRAFAYLNAAREREREKEWKFAIERNGWRRFLERVDIPRAHARICGFTPEGGVPAYKGKRAREKESLNEVVFGEGGN